MPRRRAKKTPTPRRARAVSRPRKDRNGAPSVVEGRASIDGVSRVRALFWQNLLREILTSLSVLSASRSTNTPRLAGDAPATEPLGAGQVSDFIATADDAGVGEVAGTERSYEGIGQSPSDLFDGRLAIVTTGGERIPIADVKPVFACGVTGRSGQHWLSTAIECTVFEIRTPAGEVFTLPLHEIRAFHALSDELMQRLVEAAAEQNRTEAEPDRPFGFAAFTSLARAEGAGPRIEYTYGEPNFLGE